VDRFERELDALRKELAEANMRSARSSPTMIPDDPSAPVSPIFELEKLAPSPPLLAADGTQDVPPLDDDRKER
jgi:hypothetical protein